MSNDTNLRLLKKMICNRHTEKSLGVCCVKSTLVGNLFEGALLANRDLFSDFVFDNELEGKKFVLLNYHFSISLSQRTACAVVGGVQDHTAVSALNIERTGPRRRVWSS